MTYRVNKGFQTIGRRYQVNIYKNRKEFSLRRFNLINKTNE